MRTPSRGLRPVLGLPPVRIPLAALLAASLVRPALPFAVVGYVPDYRWENIDWIEAVAGTTHLVLFSVEAAPEGRLQGLERVRALVRPTGPLQTAIRRVGGAPPKVLVCIGGTGRSSHFQKAASSQKARRRIARELAQLFGEISLFAGVDLDWETPSSAQDWRDLGKLAKEIRSIVGKQVRKPLVTMTYHPGSGYAESFANIRGKKTESRFVDLFDLCHAMAYSQLDHQRRHTSPELDRQAVEEWARAGLPLDRLALGMPFFGVPRGQGEPKTFGQMFDEDPAMMSDPEASETVDGVFFCGLGCVERKVHFALQRGLGGVMIWELGQDKLSGKVSLLKQVWGAARRAARGSWASLALAYLRSFGEDQAFALISALLGVYCAAKVATFKRPLAPGQRPPKPPPIAPPEGLEPVDEKDEGELPAAAGAAAVDAGAGAGAAAVPAAGAPEGG